MLNSLIVCFTLCCVEESNRKEREERCLPGLHQTKPWQSSRREMSSDPPPHHTPHHTTPPPPHHRAHYQQLQSVCLSLSLPESAAVKNRLQLQSLLNVGLVGFLLNENCIVSAPASHFIQRRLVKYSESSNVNVLQDKTLFMFGTSSQKKNH